MFIQCLDMFKKIFGQRKYNNDLEPSEIMLDALSNTHEVEMGRFEIPLSEITLKFFFWIFAIIFLLFFLRSSYFQVVEHDKYMELSDNNQYTFKKSQLLRGVMYDRNGVQLIENTSRFHLACKESEYKDEYVKQVAALIGRDEQELRDYMRKQDYKIHVARNLSQEEVVLLHIKLPDMPGCEILNEVTRKYKEGEKYSHLVGYIREDGKGEGVEYYYDEYLRPKEAGTKIEKDARGRIISQEGSEFSEPGNSIMLTIDSELQKKIIEELKVALESSGAATAAAIALDPKTGEVLALVSLPEYDNNLFASGFTREEWSNLINDKHSPLLNRAIAGQYPSGSTIKPFVGLAALEYDIVDETTVIYTPSRICIPNRYSNNEVCFPDWKEHGPSDIRRAIAESVNPFFYTVSGGYEDFEGMGADKMVDYLKRFNFGEKTGIDLPGEKVGILPSPEWKIKNIGSRWTLGDTYNFSIGQGFFQVTPIQMATAIASIANYGTYYQPYVVKSVVGEGKESIIDFEPRIMNGEIADKDDLRIIREGMNRTVDSESGTAHLLSYLPVKAAAKTGTAQVPTKNVYDTWIEIFAPYDDPEIVLVLLAEEVPTERFFVLKASYDILRWYFDPDKNAEPVATSTYQEVNDSVPVE